MKKIKYTKKNLILLHDGVLWHARVRKNNGAWVFKTSEPMDDSMLPEELIAWGVENGAGTVRVAVSEELTEFVFTEVAPHLIPPSELYESLAEALAEKLGAESDNIAPCVISGADLGQADSTKMWGAALPIDIIRGYAETCSMQGLRFEGATTVQVLGMLENVRNGKAANLIFLGEKESFAYGASAAEQGMNYRHIPMEAPKDALDSDYTRRVERRLRPFFAKPIRLVAPNANIEETKAAIGGIAGVPAIEFFAFSEIRNEYMQVLADARPYLLDASAGMVSVPPKKKDAKFTGGIICAGTILLSVLVLGALWGVRKYQVAYWTDMKAQVSSLNSAQKTAADNLAAAQKRLSELRDTARQIKESPPKVAGHYTEILCEISRLIPRSSWVEEISQDGQKIIVRGTTVFPKAQSDFVVALNEALGKFNKRVVPRKVNINPDEEQNEFIIEIF